MNFKKILATLAFSSAVSFSAFADDAAATQNSIIGVLGHVGYTNLQNEDDARTTSLNGYNLGVSGLYSIAPVGPGSVVAGLGLNYFNAQGDYDDSSSGTKLTATSKLATLSAELNAGYKFMASSKFELLGLANFGYGFYNSASVDLKQGGTTVAAPAGEKYDVKKHMYYGVTLAGLYDLTSSIALGGTVVYNYHTYTTDYSATGSPTESTDSKVNEISANFVFQYSL